MADEVAIEHPNRATAGSKLARLVTIVLLVASAAVVFIVAIGGWAAIEGAKPVQLAYGVIDLVLAVFVARWSRGVLPVAAALAVSLGIFAALAAPAWFDRDKDGFTDPALSADVLGLLCTLLVALQAALMVSALIGFRQRWNVEVERPAEGRRPADAEPAAA